jgi:CSLREA domain-containing protein
MQGTMRTRVLTLATIGAIGASLAFAASASAASIVVTSTADPGGTSSQCTLRQAIDSANSDATPLASNCTGGSGTDTITFAQSILPAHITLSGGELAPSSDMTIQGPGPASQVTVDGNNVTRVFEIIGKDPVNGDPGPTVTMSGLTVTGGHYFYPGPDPRGGAGIANDFNAILTVDHSVVTNNNAIADINGGGSQQFTIGQVYGGGILSNGTLNVVDTTISGNTLNANAIGGMFGTDAQAFGAGIASLNNRDLNVVRSTISGNSATATAPTGNGRSTTTSGGGIQAFSGGTASIISSTIANNTVNSGAADTVTEQGGGITSAATMTVTSSTVTGNDGLDGANLAVDPFDGSMSLANTIAAAPVSGPNCARVTSAGYNFSSDATCDPTGTGDVQNGNANLLALGNYGGPTQTRPPAAPSVGNTGVIDLGLAPTTVPATTTDQRGLARTVNYDIANPTGGDGTDIGAVEIQGATPQGTTPTSPGTGSDPVVFGDAEPSSSVSVYGDGSCTSLLGNGPASSFNSPGLDTGLSVLENTATPLSVNALYGNATSDCSTITYQRLPALPTLDSTNPASGTDDNTPMVIGTATDSSMVTIYKAAGCTGPVAGSGTGDALVTPGIQVTVANNTVTSFYAKATGVGGTTACTSTGLTYVNPPATPTLTSTNPPSGSDNNNPNLIGTATASSTVNIYTVAGCTGPVAGTGSGATLAGAGIPVSVPDNSTTSFYAKASGVGGTSGCSGARTYAEVTPAVVIPPPVVTPTPAPAAKKCKKGFKLKKVHGKKKCVKKK